jgi:hypothetical protein
MLDLAWGELSTSRATLILARLLLRIDIPLLEPQNKISAFRRQARRLAIGTGIREWPPEN